MECQRGCSTGQPMRWRLCSSRSGTRTNWTEMAPYFSWMHTNLQSPKKPSRKGISTTHKWFNDSVRRISEWRDDLQFPKAIMPVRPTHADQRIGLQRSCFTFHVPDHPNLTSGENDSLLAFRIPSVAKTNILNDLVLLGLDEFSIFGDLDHLALRLRRAYRIPWSEHQSPPCRSTDLL
jgi:hypothetical protein